MPAIKMSEREKKLAIMTLCVLVFYVFYQFLLSPRIDEIKRLKDQTQKARLELNVAEGKIKVLEGLQKGGPSPLDKSTLPKEERALEVLRALAEATSKSGLNLISIKPIIEDEKGLKFELSCSGSYMNLYNFLKIMSNLNVMVMIDFLNVIAKGDKNPVLDVKITLTAHY
jgi:Tfp pilus assembly protein PilO